MGDKGVIFEVVTTTRTNDSLIIPTDEHAHLTLWQALKKWRKVSFYSMGLTFAILMYGYDLVVIGTVAAMPSFQKNYGESLNGQWIIPSLWLSLWDLSSPFCSMFGCLLAGHFQDRAGRRCCMAVGAFFSAGGIAIMFVSYLSGSINIRRGIFLAGKGFQGAAIGMLMTAVQTYISEISPPVLRGPLLALFPIFTLIGQLVGAAVIYAVLHMSNGYTFCFASQWPFSVVPLAMAVIIPESPVYLIRKNKLDLAYKAQLRLSPAGGEVQREIEAIRRSIEAERKTAEATYMDCFTRNNLRRTYIVIFANFLPLIFGLTLLGKASYFGQVVGMKPTLSVLMLMVGLVCGLLANISSVWITTRVGRRRLCLFSLAAITVLWTTIGIAGCFRGQPTIWITAVGLILLIVAAGLGIWPASYTIASETSALHLRAKAQGLGWFVSSGGNALVGFVLPYIFNPDKGNLRGKTGFVYAALCAIAYILIFLLVPEMKGRTAAEISHMFELNLPARKFEKWSNQRQGEKQNDSTTCS